MSSLDTTFHLNPWVEDAFQIISDHDMFEVIPKMYSLKNIQSYLNVVRQGYINDIMDLLRKKLYCKETNIEFTIDDDFLLNYLSYKEGLKKFKTQVSRKMLDTARLEECYQKLIVEPEFKFNP